MLFNVGRVAQSAQRLATGWMVRGTNPGGGEMFRTCPDRPWGPPSLLYNGYRVFPGSKERPGPDADPSPPSSAVFKKRWGYTSTPPMGRTACTEPQCLYKGALCLLLCYLTCTNPTIYVLRECSCGFSVGQRIIGVDFIVIVRLISVLELLCASA
jgi:hypothetical protein